MSHTTSQRAASKGLKVLLFLFLLIGGVWWVATEIINALCGGVC